MNKGSAVVFAANEVGIINSITTAQTLGYTVIHLIVLSRSEAMSEVARRSVSRGIVATATLYGSLNKIGPLKLLWILMFPHLFLRRFFKTINRRFGRQEFGVILIQNMLSVLLFKRAFPAQEFILVDEGLSSYSGRVTQGEHRSLAFKVLGFIFFKRSYGDVVSRFFLCDPNMLVSPVSQAVFKIDFNDSLVKDLLSPDDDSVNVRKLDCCYIGVPLFGLIDLSESKNLDREKFLKRAKAVLNFLFTQSRQKITYKKHPLEDADEIRGSYEGAFSLLDGSWEEICFSRVDEETVLFNFFSTAVTFPKLILDKEPKIVFMYKLVGADIMRGDEIVERFKRNYKEPNKIFVPNDIEEFDEILALFGRGL